METLLQDLKYAVRTLRKSPAFTTIAVLCLSLGIATNTTIFSCFNAIVLRPFPFDNPDDLVAVYDRNPKNDFRGSLSYLNYLDWRDGSKSFTDLAAYSGRSIAITEGDEPLRLSGQVVSSNLFPMLGVRPQLGRLFRADEDKPGTAGVALLGDGVWRRKYAADPSIIGRVISINSLPHTVVGVMPELFKFPESSEVWIPLGPALSGTPREARALQVIGRLKTGTSVAQADRDVAAVSKAVNAQYGVANTEFVGHAVALREEFTEGEIILITSTMMGAVSFVLLIACANVANLMLARASGRQREIAVRTAIGASRGRIVRQMVTESVILAMLAGAIAVPLSYQGIRLIEMAIPPENPMPYYMHFAIDAKTLLYTGAISLLTGIVFGLAPALQASKGRLHETLKDGARGAGGSLRSNKVRNGLVIAEVGLSLVLLVGASLFMRTFMALQNTAVGFDPNPIMTMRLYLPGTRYDSTASKVAGVEDILRRVQAIPNVQAATISNLIPLEDGGAGDGVIIDGVDVEKGKEPFLSWTGVAGHWPETFGVKIVSGRTFTDGETRDSSRVAVIDQTMATRFWKDKDAVGGRFRLASDTSRQWLTVIGVVATMRIDGLDNTGPVNPHAFLPYQYLVARNHGMMVRVRAGSAAAITGAVRDAIRASDPAIPVFNVSSMEKVRSLSFWQYKLFGAMFGAFGVIALFLAAIGVYGVISYGVAQRTREIGVRVALGAQRNDVLTLVVRQGMTLAGIGIALGLLGAFGVTRVVASMLIGISPQDPMSFGLVSLFLAAVAFVASVVPARRATRVDPIISLRAE
ncbi:MAG: ABC transporter permease [Phycisphaerae bacterium]|nr:ABC transporter permease [Gemmatimonadaceae bacterium]